MPTLNWPRAATAGFLCCFGTRNPHHLLDVRQRRTAGVMGHNFQIWQLVVEIESQNSDWIDCRFRHPGHCAMLGFDRRQGQQDCIRFAERIVSGNVSLTGCITLTELCTLTELTGCITLTGVVRCPPRSPLCRPPRPAFTMVHACKPYTTHKHNTTSTV